MVVPQKACIYLYIINGLNPFIIPSLFFFYYIFILMLNTDSDVFIIWKNAVLNFRDSMK